MITWWHLFKTLGPKILLWIFNSPHTHTHIRLTPSDCSSEVCRSSFSTVRLQSEHTHKGSWRELDILLGCAVPFWPRMPASEGTAPSLRSHRHKRQRSPAVYGARWFKPNVNGVFVGHHRRRTIRQIYIMRNSHFSIYIGVIHDKFVLWKKLWLHVNTGHLHFKKKVNQIDLTHCRLSSCQCEHSSKPDKFNSSPQSGYYKQADTHYILFFY